MKAKGLIIIAAAAIVTFALIIGVLTLPPIESIIVPSLIIVAIFCLVMYLMFDMGRIE